VDGCDSRAFEFVGAGTMIPSEHRLVYRYPQQQSNEMIGSEPGIVNVQESAVGEVLKTHC
jgi:hypothetical protein